MEESDGRAWSKKDDYYNCKYNVRLGEGTAKDWLTVAEGVLRC